MSFDELDMKQRVVNQGRGLVRACLREEGGNPGLLAVPSCGSVSLKFCGAPSGSP